MTDLLYSEVEEDLRASVRSTLDRYLAWEAVRDVADGADLSFTTLRKVLSDDLGIAGLIVPESHGGVGASTREAAVVLEELGRSVAPVPFLTSSVIAATALVELGETQLLEEIAGGVRTAALVLPWSAPAGGWTPWQADAGSAVRPVAGALQADTFLVPVRRGEETSLVALGSGDVEVSPLPSLDVSRPLAAVLPTRRGTVVAEGPQVQAAVDRALMTGAALLASEQLGIALWCLETTVDYVRTRIQFGRPIGSFQAVKHRLADLYLDIVLARAAARNAADAVATADQQAQIATAVAASWCSDVAVRAAEEALQLHAGVAMTWEYPVHLYLKRAKSSQVALGSPIRHRHELAGLVGLAGETV